MVGRDNILAQEMACHPDVISREVHSLGNNLFRFGMNIFQFFWILDN